MFTLVAHLHGFKLQKLNLLILFFTISFSLFGQLEIAEQVTLGVTENLDEREVRHVVRDPLGYFYFFYSNSIQRYDGSELQSVQYDEIDAYNTNFINLNAVLIDSTGRIILDFNRNGALHYIEKGGLELISKPVPKITKPFGLSAFNGVVFHEIKNDTIYILREYHELEHIVIPKGIINKPIADMSYFNDEIYLETIDDQIFSYKKNRFRFLGDGKLKATSQKLLLAFKDRIEWFKKDRVDTFVLDQNYYWPKVIHIDKEGNALLSYGFKNNEDSYEMYFLKEGELHNWKPFLTALPNNYLISMYAEDCEEAMIIGSHLGAFIFKFQPKHIEKIFDNKESQYNFGNVITDVIADFDSLYIIRQIEGLYKWDNGSVKRKFAAFDNLGYFERNKCFFQPSKEKLIVATLDAFSSKIFTINPLENTFRVAQKYFDIHDIFSFGKDSLVYVGGNISGKGYYYEDFPEHRDSIILNIESITSGLKGRQKHTCWLGTTKGLYLFDRSALSLLQIGEKTSIKKKLSEQDITMLTYFNDDLLVCTRGNGLFIVDPTTLVVKGRISKNEGLSDDMLVSAIEDHEGQLWVGTYNGINVLDSQYRVIKKLFTHDGLPGNEMNTAGVTIDSKGKISFASTNGVVRINPSPTLYSKYQSVQIDKILYHEQGEEKVIPFHNKPVSLVSINEVKVQINIVDYISNKYKSSTQVILVNGDTTVMDKSGVFSLSKLRYGLNEFHLKTLTGEYLSSLIIHRKYNLTFYGLILGSIMIIGPLTYFVTRHLMRSKNRERRKAEKIKQQIIQLKLSALQSQMNPHFIFNALGSIQYFIQMNESDKAEFFLERFSKLVRGILESSKVPSIALKSEINMLDLYMQLERIRFDEKFDYNLVIEDGVNQEFKLPPMIIQPFIENSINHGLYHLLDRKGELILKFEQIDEDNIKCTIQDNGIGRERAKSFKRKDHKSRGIEIIGERQEALKYIAEYDVEIQVSDVLGAEGVMGTKVEIYFEKL